MFRGYLFRWEAHKKVHLYKITATSPFDRCAFVIFRQSIQYVEKNMPGRLVAVFRIMGLK